MAGQPYSKVDQCGPPRKPARRRPIRHRSPKKQLEVPEREHVRLAVQARDLVCIPILMGAPGRCASPDGGRPRLEVHEVKTRARGGSTLNLANCLLTCQRHHDWITAHPVEAHALGLVRWSWEGEPSKPLRPFVRPLGADPEEGNR
jgi:5-methylcytosine-specific restriction endonuclease McrA